MRFHLADTYTYHSSEFSSAGLYVEKTREPPTKLPGLKTWQPVYVTLYLSYLSASMSYLISMKIKSLQQGWDAYRSWQRIKAQAVIVVRKGGLDIDGQGGEVALV